MKPSGRERGKPPSLRRSVSDLAHQLSQNDLKLIRSELTRIRKNLENLEGLFILARSRNASPGIPGPLPNSGRKSEGGLSVREQEVMRYVTMGMTDKQIGQKMYVSVNTVKTHLRRIFSKLDAGNRTEAVSRYRG